MSELYTGTKFKYVNKSKTFPEHKDLNLLKSWCDIFNINKFAPPYPGGSSGNLSFRTKMNSNNFIITASHTSLSDAMKDSDFSEVVFCSVSKNIVHSKGIKSPSSETLMHYLIYKSRPDVNAIFHGHSAEIMKLAKQKAFPETKKELEYGTVELAEDVVNALKNYNFVILKNHGFVSVGKTQNEVGNQIFEL